MTECIHFALDQLPEGATMHAVTATPVEIAGRRALCVTLTPAVTLHGTPDVDFHDEPTFVRIPATFRSGVIEFDVLSRLNSMAPEYARAFAGIAYRINRNRNRFESVYLRPLNGSSLNPPAPRDVRAVQYFAYPDWKFDRLRQVYPQGPFEAAADVKPNAWMHVRLDIHERRLVASVEGKPVLSIDETLVTPSFGDVGLWVDIGTEAFFADLRITPEVE